jgi:membrane-associated protein
VYVLLFLIVFVETGVVVMPFLPGDSLLFVVGALCGVGFMSYPVACAVLIAAAILGDQCNYSIGRYFGPKVFQWEQSRYFNRRAFDQAHAFYEKYGGVTIILARFMPFLRTFAPFVAGVAEMTRTKFTAFNVAGALIWVLGIVTGGLLPGQHALGQGQPGQDHLGHDFCAGVDRAVWGVEGAAGIVFFFVFCLSVSGPRYFGIMRPGHSAPRMSPGRLRRPPPLFRCAERPTRMILPP